MDSQKQLRRSNNKMIAGVCGGIAEYFGVDPTLVRLVFIVVGLVTAIGPVALLYIILMVLMPPAQ